MAQSQTFEVHYSLWSKRPYQRTFPRVNDHLKARQKIK